MTGEARPFPKAQQLARGERRYRRKVAGPKQWQAIIAEKGSACRLFGLAWSDPDFDRDCWGATEYHHLVPRDRGGDDTADNIVPLCQKHHALVTAQHVATTFVLVTTLSEAESAYLSSRGGGRS